MPLTRKQLRISSLSLLLFIVFQYKTNAIKHNFISHHYFKGRLYQDYIFDQINGIDSNIERLDTYDESVCPDDHKQKIMVAYFDQPLDHFDEKSERWQQHYQVNDKFFKNSNRPIIFLKLGGESAMSNTWVCYETSTFMQAAKSYNAKVIQLEHRFFGHNKGLRDLSVANLKYLTVEQALADINTFILGYNKSHKWNKPRWVVFGGSYPGTLAALLRLKYPGLTEGAIASSAPLRPVVDFWEYGSVMERTIKDTSQVCYNSIKSAFKTLRNFLTTPSGRKILNEKLNLVPEFNEKRIREEDIETVAVSILNAFEGIVQYTYIGMENKHNIAFACKIMTDQATKDPIDRLYKIYELATKRNMSVLASYEYMLQNYKDTYIGNVVSGAERGWMWLSCNEFGWLQRTSAESDLFGNLSQISYYTRMCFDLFNLNATQVYQQVKDTESRYGSNDNYNATNVFLPNGLYDPWSSIGVQNDKNLQKTRESQHLITYFIPRAAHCADMLGYYKGEPEGLTEARKIVTRELTYYLKQKPSSITRNYPILMLNLIFSLIYFSLFN